MPGGSTGMTYRPSGPVTTARTSPVLTFRAVTLTPGSTLRFGSSTVPLMAAAVCAHAAGTAAGTSSRSSHIGNTRDCIEVGLLQIVPERDCSKPQLYQSLCAMPGVVR
jgi:hypothetical protein